MSKIFLLARYRANQKFPTEEKFALVQQIRRAALSVHLNIAEGCSRKSFDERKRFFESRGFVKEGVTAFENELFPWLVQKKIYQTLANI